MRYMLIAALLVGCGGSSSAPDAAIDARPFTTCPTDKWFTDLYGTSSNVNCNGVEQCAVESNLSPLRSTCFIGNVDSECRRLGSTDTCCELKKDPYPLYNHMVIRNCDPSGL